MKEKYIDIKLVRHYNSDWNSCKYDMTQLYVFTWKLSVFIVLKETINCYSLLNRSKICFGFFSNISFNWIKKNI